MKITEKLANSLMDCLCCLAISAVTTHKGADETPETMSKEHFEAAEAWARDTFVKTLCAEWEDFYDEEMEVVVQDGGWEFVIEDEDE